MDKLKEKLQHCDINNIISQIVTSLSFQQQNQTIIQWAANSESRFILVANCHMLMESHYSPSFNNVLQSADLVTPDGMSLVWAKRLLGQRHQMHAAGMDIFLALCQESSKQGLSVFFVGSQKDILGRIRLRLDNEFPGLKIAGMAPLPFRPLTREEDELLTDQINESGAGIVFVSLGCPKQEFWMSAHKGKIQAVMIGMGGVFPIYAGLQMRAPRWIRESGLEWLYRLLREPRRLWKRYGTTIPPFIWLFLVQTLSRSVAGSLSSQSEKIKKNFPEEWISDLETLKKRLLKLDKPKWVIELKIFFVLLTMYWAKFRINVENTSLPEKERRKTD